MQVTNVTQLLKAVAGMRVAVHLYGAYLFPSKKQLRQWAKAYFNNSPDNYLNVQKLESFFIVYRYAM